MEQQVKIIGQNGQLSLGKAFAGQMVLISQIDKGTWIVKSGEFIPDSERLAHEAKQVAKIDEACEWAAKNKPVDNFKKLLKGMGHD